jgi:hypothetical protein
VIQNDNVSKHPSNKEIPVSFGEFRRKSAVIRSEVRIKRETEYLKAFSKGDYFLMKSFTAVYIAANTPRSDRIMVKTGVSSPKSLSSFIPPQTVTRMIMIIWTPSPVYLA